MILRYLKGKKGFFSFVSSSTLVHLFFCFPKSSMFANMIFLGHAEKIFENIYMYMHWMEFVAQGKG